MVVILTYPQFSDNLYTGSIAYVQATTICREILIYKGGFDGNEIN